MFFVHVTGDTEPETTRRNDGNLFSLGVDLVAQDLPKVVLTA